MTYIYESPDGGETVYRRKSGQVTRELYSVSKEKEERDQQVKEEMLWTQIARAARSNPALQEALDRARVIYELGRDYN
jgi:hypothetical protein